MDVVGKNHASGPCLAVGLARGINHTILVTLPVSVTKYSDEGSSTGRGLLWSVTQGYSPLHAGNLESRAWALATSHLQSGDRETGILALNGLPLFYVIQDAEPWNGPARVLGGSSYLQLP